MGEDTVKVTTSGLTANYSNYEYTLGGYFRQNNYCYKSYFKS